MGRGLVAISPGLGLYLPQAPGFPNSGVGSAQRGGASDVADPLEPPGLEARTSIALVRESSLSCCMRADPVAPSVSLEVHSRKASVVSLRSWRSSSTSEFSLLLLQLKS